MYDKLVKRTFILIVMAILFCRLLVYGLEEVMGISQYITTVFLIIIAVPISYLIKHGLNRLTDNLKKDDLTGLYTRKYSNMVSDIINANSPDNKMTIFLFDIDNFKYINDKYGHNKGDEVLKYVSDVLEASVRSNDIVMRWGGDEFIVAYRSTISAERITSRLDKKISEISDLLDFDLSVSKGMASFPEDGTTFKSLVEVADQRMYEEKNSILDDKGVTV